MERGGWRGEDLSGERGWQECGKADGWRARGVRVTSSLVGNDGSGYGFEQAGNLPGPPPSECMHGSGSTQPSGPHINIIVIVTYS